MLQRNSDAKYTTALSQFCQGVKSTPSAKSDTPLIIKTITSIFGEGKTKDRIGGQKMKGGDQTNGLGQMKILAFAYKISQLFEKTTGGHRL